MLSGYDLYIRITEHDTSTFKEEIIVEEVAVNSEVGSHDAEDVATLTDLGLGTSIATKFSAASQNQPTRVEKVNEGIDFYMKKEYNAVRKLHALSHGSKKLHRAAKEGKRNLVKVLIEDRRHNPMEMDEAESTALHHAAQGGHKNVLEYLVQEQDCNPSCSGPCSITPLHLAACNCHLEVVQFLIDKHGMDPMCHTETGRTPLHFACQCGDTAIVTYLIQEVRKYMPIDVLLIERTIEGHTPLHIAAHYGHLSLIQLLISNYNCDSCISGQHGRLPIHHAAIEGHLHIVKYFIEVENCESSCVDELKSTPLHLASSTGHLDVVQYLVLEKQCDPYCEDLNKHTPFEVAAINNQIQVVKFFVQELDFLVDITKSMLTGNVMNFEAVQYVESCLKLFSASYAGDLGKIKKLVEAEHYNMFQMLANGRTIIHYASEGCHLDVLKYYVDEKRCNPVCYDKNFVTPLHLAAGRGCLEIVKYLTLEKRFPPSPKDDRGEIPLHYAACNCDSIKVVEFFITNLNIQPNIPGNLGKTILHYACENRCIELIRWLFIDHYLLSLQTDTGGCSPLHGACVSGDVEVVRLLMKEMKYKYILENTTSINRLIFETTAAGHLNIIKILISELSCNLEITGEEGRLPLHCAADNGHAHIVKYLIEELNCDQNCTDDHGSTPLHLAAKNGHLDIVWYLTVDRNCRFYIDKGKNNPLHEAVIHGQQSVVQHFVEVLHVSRMKSLEFARDNGHHQIVQYLTFIQLQSASRSGNLNKVKRLIEEELCDPRYEPGSGDSALNCAIKSGHLDILKFFAKKRQRKPTLLEVVEPGQHYVVSKKTNLGLVKLFTLDKDGNPILKCYSRESDIPLHVTALDRRDFNISDSCGRYPLHLASENGHIHIVKYLTYELQCDTDCVDSNGASPLYLAASNGHLQVIEYLISSNMCDPQITDINGNTPLHIATRCNHLDIIKFFIEDLQFLPSTKGEFGLTPLELALNEKHTEIAKYFQLAIMHFELCSSSLDEVRRMVEIEGCDPMMGLVNMRTAVHCAAENGSLNVLKYFIEERGCDPQCKDRNNCTPLHLAAKSGHLDAVKYLILDRMCDPNIKDDKGNSPIHYAARDSGNLNMIIFFVVEADCDPNLRGHGGKTPLQYAAENSHLSLVQYLFSKNAINDVDQLSMLNAIHHEDPASYFIQQKFEKHHLHSASFKGDLSTVICLIEEHGRYELQRLQNGKTALHLAAEGGHLHVVKYFVEERQCNILLSDKNNATPLHLAAAKGYLAIVKYFTKEKKCNPCIKDINGDSPLHYALRGNRNIDVIKFFIFELNCDPNISGHFGKTLLHYAVKFKNLQMISFLDTDAQVDIMQWDSGGFSPLHRACQHGDSDIVACLLKEKVVDDIYSDRNVIGFTPLHTASLFGNLEIVKQLVNNLNCNPNIPSFKHGILPLHLAAQGGHTDTVRYLVGVKKCDPCCCDDFNVTPLHLAVVHGHLDTIKYLSLERACDPQCFTVEGYTPLHYAARIGKFEVVKSFVMDLHCQPHIKGMCTMTPSEIAESQGHSEVAEYLNLALPLHIAVLRGDFDEVRRLVEEEHHDPLEPHKIDDGKTALHYAADAGHLTLLKYFIEMCNCSQNCCDDDSITPLHLASKSGHLNVVKYLTLVKNTDPNIKDNEGNTPCHYATSGKKCLSVLKFLAKDLRCDLSAYNDFDETPLDYAAEARLNEFFSMLVSENMIGPWCGDNNSFVSALQKIYEEETGTYINHTLPKDPLLLAAFNGELEWVKQLIEMEGCQSMTDLVNGKSALHCVAEGGHLHMIKYMIEEQHCPTTCFDENKATPLHFAAGKGHLEIVKYLILDQKCDPVVRDIYNNSPLHYASRDSGSVDVVMFFISELNCNPNDQNAFGKTVLHLAAEYNHIQLVQHLMASNKIKTLVWDIGSFTPLHRVCSYNNHTGIVQCLIQDMNLKDLQMHMNCLQFSPIHTAIICGHIELINLFIRILKFDPSKPISDQDKFPLHYAAYVGHEHVVRFLVDVANCDPLCKDSNGLTPLHLAAREGHLNIIKYLVKEKQCDCFCCTVDGDTPLHYAARFGKDRIVRFFVKKFRCPPYIKGKFNMTPLEEANSRGHTSVTAILEDVYPLHFAAYRGDIELVKQFTSESYNPYKLYSGYTALHCVAESGHLAVLKYFVEELHCNPVCFDSCKVTPLHYAFYKGNLDIIKYLVLERKCDPYIEDIGEFTPVHCIAFCSTNIDWIKLLVTDMNFDFSDTKSYNILLSSAAEAKQLKLIQYMVTNYPVDMLCEEDVYDKISDYPTNKDETSTLYCPNPHHMYGLCLPSHEGDLKKVRELVEDENHDPNESFKSALHCAAEGGHLHILKFYIEERHFHPMCYYNHRTTPLHLAAGKGNLNVIKYLILHHKCDPMIKDSDGNTPLHYTARDCGNIDVIKFFIYDLMCDPNCAGYFCKTPLHYATQTNRIGLIKNLLSIRQINPLCWDEGGFSPLHRACQFGWVDIVQCFISSTSYKQFSADINVFGFTPLHTASFFGQINVIKLLYEKFQSDLNTLFSLDGKSALHHAALRGNKDIVQYLIEEQNCEPTFTDNNKLTPLHLAAKCNNVDIVEYLAIKQKLADTILLSTNSDSPLHFAARFGCLSVVKFFISILHCPPDIKGSGALTPLDLANKYNHCDVIDYLELTLPLHVATYRGNLDEVKHLTEAEFNDPLQKHIVDNERTALHGAADAGHLNILKYFIEEQHCTPLCFDRDNITPLHVAAGKGQIEIIKYLIFEANCDPSVKDSNGDTPLHYAVQDDINMDAVICFFIDELHCNPNNPDHLGKTILHYAAQKGHLNLLKYLVEDKGCSYMCQDIYMATPMHYAACKGHLDIIDYLLLDKNTDPFIEDVYGRSALSVAVTYGYLHIIDILSKNPKAIEYARQVGANVFSSKRQESNNEEPHHISEHVGIQEHCAKIAVQLQPPRRVLELGPPRISRHSLSQLQESNDHYYNNQTLHQDEAEVIYCNENAQIKAAKNITLNHFLSYFLAQMMALPINNDNNVLQHLVVGLLYSATSVGKLEEIKYLIELEDCKTLFNPEIAVELAIEGGQLLALKYFIEAGYLQPTSVFGENKITLLHLVAGEGHLELFKYLTLEKMCDPSMMDDSGDTPLHYAVRGNGSYNLIAFIIKELKCDPNAYNCVGKTPLHYAVNGKKLELVKYLFNVCDAQLLSDKNGNTPVHQACLTGSLDILALFESRLILDTEQRNNNQQALLHIASLHGHLEIIKYLISEIKCDPNVIDKRDWLPLHYAANEGYLHIVRYLTEEQQCNPCYGKFPALHLAAAKGHLDILKYFFLDRLCDPFCADKYHNTTLHVAVEANQIDVVKYLVGTLHYPPYIKGYCNTTPQQIACIRNYDQIIEYFQSPLHLHIASCKGDLDQIKQLVEEKCDDPNLVSPFDCCGNEMNALHSAALNGYLSVLKYFIDVRNCKAVCFDKNKATPLHLAAGSGHLEVVKYLTIKCNPFESDAHGDTPLHYAIHGSGSIDVVDYFIAELTFDPNIRGSCGRTPLHLAVENNHVQVIKYLVNIDRVDHLCKDDSGFCPLQKICKNDISSVRSLYSTENKQKIITRAVVDGCLDTLDSLIAILDCDPCVLDSNGRSLVHYAAENGDCEILNYSVKVLGCSPYCTDNDGVTPLHIAACHGYLNVLNVLILDWLCDPLPLTAYDDTPLHYATQAGQFDVIKLYIEHFWCSPQLKGSFYQTPMDLACNHGHYDILKYFQLALVHLVSRRGDLEKIKQVTAIEHVDPFQILGNGKRFTTIEHLDPFQMLGSEKTAIHCAAEGGHLPILMYFFKNVTRSFVRKNPTVVHVAAGKGHLDIVKYLVLDIGFNSMATDIEGNTPLHYVARDSGSVSVASFLITEMKCDPNAQANGMGTPLHYAAVNMHLELTRYLVFKQKVCQLYDSKGHLPIHKACQNCDIQLVRCLINCMSEDEILTKDKSSPLHIAARFGHLNIVQYLMNCKLRLDPKDSDRSGTMPLHLAAEEGHLEVVKYLIEKKDCDPLSMNVSHDTPLNLAASKGHLHVVKYLTLNQHCDPQDCSDTVLHVAAKHGHLQVVKYLIESLQCQPDSLDSYNCSPLDLAKLEGHFHVVRYLELAIVSKHGDGTAHTKHPFLGEESCNQLQSKRKTILHFAAEIGHLKLLQFILQSSENSSVSVYFDENNVTPLHLAAGKGYVDIVRYLTVNKHCDPAVKDDNGDSPLHYVAFDSGSVNVARFLRMIMNCTLTITNRHNQTPLHIAAAKGNTEMVKFLLSQKCDITMKDNLGITPLQIIVCNNENIDFFVALYPWILHLAAKHDSIKTVRCLIEQHKLDVMDKDDEGYVPLHRACKGGNVEVVEYLLDRMQHTDPKYLCDNKHTLLETAAQSGHHEIVNLLSTVVSQK